MRGKAIKRVWRSRGPTGHRVKHVAFGYSLWVNGHRERRYESAWTREDAEKGLAERLLGLEQEEAAKSRPKSVKEVVDEYLPYKLSRGKRSLRDDKRILTTRWVPYFGADTPITAVTTEAIACYERDRTDVSADTVANELSVLRLARRWGYLRDLPDIVFPEKPKGRRRYMTEDEIARLLTACDRSRNRYLKAIVTLALNTGMRKGEILGLT